MSISEVGVLQGRVAVVTGAGSGIGRATAIELADAAADVFGADLNVAGLDKTRKLIEGDSGSFVGVQCDVTAAGDLDRLYAAAASRFGGVDIVCNIAGVGGGDDWLTDSDGEWRRVIDIDLVAVIDATRAALTHLRDGGIIVNVASLIGLYPMASAAIYGAAKAGVVHFTRSLADIGAQRNCHAVAICPELVDTPLAETGMGADAMSRLRQEGAVVTPADIGGLIRDIVVDPMSYGTVVQITQQGGVETIDLTPTTVTTETKSSTQ